MLSNNNKFIFGIIALIVVIVGFYISYRIERPPNSVTVITSTLENREEGLEYEIVMTDEGFSPENISIFEGQTIKFVNNKNKDFWPASNFHPTHTLFPELDPGQPVSAGGSWSFTFLKAGEYRYHDHLFPSANGVISVLSLEEGVVANDFENCFLDGDTSDPRCWDILIQDGWEKMGVKGGFDVISYLYQNEPTFLNDSCHRYAHVVGDFAYEEFYPDRENYKNWDLPPETVSCNYGFYHGLFEHIFREDRDLTLAVNVCDHLTEKFSDDFPAIRRSCYHGIGHGFMPESPPKDLWGDPLKMADNSLEICSQIQSGKMETSECYQGVFNVLADWIDFKNFNLEPNKEDPFWVCENQNKEEYREACYYEFAMRVPNYVNMDLKIVADKFIKKIEDDNLAGVIIHSASATLAERNMVKDDLSILVFDCRDIPERLHKDCVQGLAGGIVAHGEPEKEYIKAIDFCSSSKLTKNEKDLCFKNIFQDLSASYTSDEMKTACRYLKDLNYKDQCQEQI